MSQIAKTKKKGRPSKSDLARRAAAVAEEQKSDGRRSLRRRDVRYTFDLDDFIEEEEEEDEQRKEKKKSSKQQNSESGSESAQTRTRRGEHAPATSLSECEDGDRPSKRRKIDGDDEIDGGDEDNEVRFGLNLSSERE